MRRGRHWPKVLIGLLIFVSLVAEVTTLVLAGLTSPLRPPIGAAGVGEGPLARALAVRRGR